MTTTAKNCGELSQSQQQQVCFLIVPEMLRCLESGNNVDFEENSESGTSERDGVEIMLTIFRRVDCIDIGVVLDHKESGLVTLSLYDQVGCQASK